MGGRQAGRHEYRKGPSIVVSFRPRSLPMTLRLLGSAPPVPLPPLPSAHVPNLPPPLGLLPGQPIPPLCPRTWLAPPSWLAARSGLTASISSRSLQSMSDNTTSCQPSVD